MISPPGRLDRDLLYCILLGLFKSAFRPFCETLLGYQDSNLD